jgi:hypothetical protein
VNCPAASLRCTRVFALPPGLPKWTAALPLQGLHFMTPTRGRYVGGPARELRDWHVGMGWCQKRRN